MGVKATASTDLRKAVGEWCMILDRERQSKNSELNVRVFECKKQDF